MYSIPLECNHRRALANIQTVVAGQIHPSDGIIIEPSIMGPKKLTCNLSRNKDKDMYS